MSLVARLHTVEAPGLDVELQLEQVHKARGGGLYERPARTVPSKERGIRWYNLFQAAGQTHETALPLWLGAVLTAWWVTSALAQACFPECDGSLHREGGVDRRARVNALFSLLTASMCVYFVGGVRRRLHEHGKLFVPLMIIASQMYSYAASVSKRHTSDGNMPSLTLESVKTWGLGSWLLVLSVFGVLCAVLLANVRSAMKVSRLHFAVYVGSFFATVLALAAASAYIGEDYHLHVHHWWWGTFVACYLRAPDRASAIAQAVVFGISVQGFAFWGPDHLWELTI